MGSVDFVVCFQLWSNVYMCAALWFIFTTMTRFDQILPSSEHTFSSHHSSIALVRCTDYSPPHVSTLCRWTAMAGDRSNFELELPEVFPSTRINQWQLLCPSLVDDQEAGYAFPNNRVHS